LLANPFCLRNITTDPHLLAHVNKECSDDRYPELKIYNSELIYRDADKSLARPTSPCILFNGENISFDASLVIYINSTNIPSIMIINRIYETQ
jgi:hypothetical protein